MGRLDELLDLYIRSAEISGIAVKPNGSIETVDSVGIDRELHDVLLCCRRPGHTTIARLIERSGEAIGQLQTINLARAIAEDMFITLIDHDLVVRRSFQAVSRVDRQINDARHTGDLKEWTKQYKTARVDNPKLTYADFLHTKKIAHRGRDGAAAQQALMNPQDRREI